MTNLAFQQVDVFAAEPLRGNALAVVLGADGLGDARMAAFARWTNLSETTFLLEPTQAGADYRVRIFTPEQELDFAGHPTLGSCHAWLGAGGQPRGATIVQECAAGLVPIRRQAGRLAFAAPPLRRTGEPEPELVARIAGGLGLAPDRIVASQWVDNGPGWVAVMLRSRDEVLALRPDLAALAGLFLGVVAPWGPDLDAAGSQSPTWEEERPRFEVRAFVPGSSIGEDPVTGSLNAGLAQWMIGAGMAPPAYVVSQGTVLGCCGRVHVRQEDGAVWVGGATTTVISGAVTL